jgi:hypothetical protein
MIYLYDNNLCRGGIEGNEIRVGKGLSSNYGVVVIRITVDRRLTDRMELSDLINPCNLKEVKDGCIRRPRS